VDVLYHLVLFTLETFFFMTVAVCLLGMFVKGVTTGPGAIALLAMRPTKREA
jgi:hypothetical protein